MRVILFLFVFSFVSFFANASSLGDIKPITPTKVQSQTALKSKAQQQFIIQLQQEPVLKHARQKLGLKKNKLRRLNQLSGTKGYRTRLKAERNDTWKSIQVKNKDARLLREYEDIVSAIVVSTRLSKQELKRIKNVKAVYPVQRYKKALSELNTIIDSASAWQLVGGKSTAGQGIKIAVIDSGITPDHPMFDDSGFAALPSNELPSDDYCSKTDSSFCNNKLIVARYFKPSFIDIDSEGEFESPKALSGHGTHVAGIATGREVTASNGQTISGVAPAAYLMAYKALWGQDGDGSDLELFDALTAAAMDGADVINNSWGGSAGGNPNFSIYQDIFSELEANGIVVVTAAGNEGLAGIACPGCVEAGITVGATSTLFRYVSEVRFNGDAVESVPADNVTDSLDVIAPAQVATGNNELGCSAFADDFFVNKIAVIKRGTCNFEDKANNAELAGALALIVFNNEPNELITMSMNGASLPSVFISEEDGATLTNFVTNNPNLDIRVNTESSVDESNKDKMVDYSSVGPNGDDSFIKPDLVAPGDNILSATSQEDEFALGEDYMRSSGTSMATPAVAGVAALLKQNNSLLTAYAIKQILSSASVSEVTNLMGTGFATPFEMGAGRLDAFKALSATAYPNKTNQVVKNCLLTCSVENTLVSVVDGEQTWQASIEFNNDLISAVASPQQVTLNGVNSEAPFAINVTLPYNMPKDWYFGRITWTSNTGLTMNQTLVLNNQQSESVLLQVTKVANSSTNQSVTIDSLNITDNNSLTYKLDIIGEAEFDVDSLATTGGQNVSVVTNEAQSIEINADVATGKISAGEPPVTVDLTSDDNPDIDCGSGTCDDILLSYELGISFEHFGETYNSIQVSDNGFLIVGDSPVPSSADLAFNVGFPDDSQPNNIVAPFWSDFDLLNPALASDDGGGTIRVATAENSGINYVVVQWDKIKVYSDNTQGSEYWGFSDLEAEFSFQVIIEEGTERKWFRYLSIPQQPNWYSVGTENQNGTVGKMYWFDGTGTASVNSGDALEVSAGDIGAFQIMLDINKNSEGNFAVNDHITAIEDTEKEIDVLVNDLVGGAMLSSSVAGIESLTALYEASSDVTLDPNSIEITTQPSNGSVSISSSNTLLYQPNGNYTGSDEFTYSVKNNLGESSTAKVIIEIIAVNDVPIIGEIVAPGSVVEGDSFQLSISVEDEDSSPNVSWQLPDLLASDNTNQANIEVTAEDGVISETTTMTIEVVVTDGNHTETRSVDIEIIKKPEEKDEGFLGLSLSLYNVLLLMLLIGLRRRDFASLKV